MADELAVDVVREPEVDRSEPLVEQRAALVAAHPHQRPDARVLRDLPQRVFVTRLERLQAHTRAFQVYVKHAEKAGSDPVGV